MSSCAARVPPQKRAESIMKNYFQRYAKKYPTTVFGQHEIARVELISQKELRKNMSAAEAYVILENGDVRKINATLEKKNIFWKLRSWENPEGM